MFREIWQREDPEKTVFLKALDRPKEAGVELLRQLCLEKDNAAYGSQKQK